MEGNKGRIFSSQHYNITYFDVGYASNEKRMNLDIATSTLGELQVNTYHINEGLNSRLKKQKIPYAYRNSNSKAFRNIGITLSLKIAAGSGHTSIIDTKNEENLLKKKNKEMQRIRGNEIAMIYQDPMSTLNPMNKVGDQIGEALIIHKKATKKEVRNIVVGLMKQVGIAITLLSKI